MLKINRFATVDDVDVNIVVKTSGEQNVKKLANVMDDADKKARDVQNLFSNLKFGINPNSLNNSIKQLETIKKLITTIQSGSTSQNRMQVLKGGELLDKSGFMKTLAPSTQTTVSALMGATGIANDQQQVTDFNAALNSLLDLLKNVNSAMSETNSTSNTMSSAMSSNANVAEKFNSTMKELAYNTNYNNSATGASMTNLSNVTYAVKTALDGLNSSMGAGPTHSSNYRSAVSILTSDLSKLSNTSSEVVKNLIEIKKAAGGTGASLGTGTSGIGTLLGGSSKAPEIKEGNKALKEQKTLLDEVTEGFRSLSIVKLTYLWHSIRRVSSGLVNMVKNAADYEESLNLYKMALGKYVDDASKWSAEITDKLMIDESELMKYTGTFFNLSEGLGVASDDAFVMSQALTQLTYDMASYLNISNEAANAKLQSAMAGQSRAIQGVGVATQAASLQTLAYELGIEKSVSKMTQAEKTYLRYIQIMRSTTHMQGDLARTMITPANALRILNTQFRLLGRAIGQVLTPIIMKAIPWIMAITNALTSLAQRLAAFLGFKITDINYEDIFKDGSSAVEDYGDSVDKAGKKIKRSLAPFDELNVVSSTSGSGSGGLEDTILDDLSKYVNGYDMLAGYTDDLKKKAQELEKYLFPILTGLITLFGMKKGWDLGKWLLGGVNALTGTGAASAMAPGTVGAMLGTLLKYAVIGGAVAVTIVCAVKIIGDVLELQQLYAAMEPASKNQHEIVVSGNQSVKDSIANNTIVEDAPQHVEDLTGTLMMQGSRANAIQEMNRGVDALAMIVTGGLDDWRKKLKATLGDYAVINEQVSLLVDSGELTQDQLLDIRSLLWDQEEDLEYIVKNSKKGSENYKTASKALKETRANIDKISDLVPPLGDRLKVHFENRITNAKNATEKLRDTLTGGVTNAFDVLLKRTGLFGGSLDGVKDKFKSMGGFVGLIDAALSGTGTTTKTWGKILHTVAEDTKTNLFAPFDGLFKSLDKKRTVKADVDKKSKEEITDTTEKVKSLSDPQTVVANVSNTLTKQLDNTKRLIDTAFGKRTISVDADVSKAKDKISGIFKGMFTKESALGKAFAKLGINAFASGGYPTSGELFFANENGRAEFITSIGNKTAVANQDQMVQALTNAIMAGFAMTAPRNNNNQPITVNIGDKKVYSGVVGYQNRQADRYGTTTTINV